MATFARSIDAVTVTPALVMPFEAEDEAQTIVHPVSNAEYPDATLRPATASAGVIRLFFLTFDDVEAARLFFRPASTFTTTAGPSWLPARFVPQGRIRRTQDPDRPGRWMLEVPYQELAP